MPLLNRQISELQTMKNRDLIRLLFCVLVLNGLLTGKALAGCEDKGNCEYRLTANVVGANGEVVVRFNGKEQRLSPGVSTLSSTVSQDSNWRVAIVSAPAGQSCVLQPEAGVMTRDTQVTITCTDIVPEPEPEPEPEPNTINGWCEYRAFTSQETNVLKAYLAFYGRPADTGGLSYWAGHLAEKKGDIAAIMDPFANSEEFRNRFGSLANEDLIDNLFLQQFGRIEDHNSAGFQYWLDELQSGRRSLQNIALAIMDGAQNQDLAVVNARVEAVQHFITRSEGAGRGVSETNGNALVLKVQASAQAACLESDYLLGRAAAGVDSDSDGVKDNNDRFPGDGGETTDSDGDGWGNNSDNCPSISNVRQEDGDGDGVGNLCDSAPGDSDGDGVNDAQDNCTATYNPSQGDFDGDGTGDACDDTPNGDQDGDGVDNAEDNCLSHYNPSQLDADRDGIGDACDGTPTGDMDFDGVDDAIDNCPTVSNGIQADSDNDGIGDACELVSIPLNDTGISWGTDYPSGNNLRCEGEAVSQQDCSHGRDATHPNSADGAAGFKFTKLDQNGNMLSAEATDWDCVQDNVTGLVWEVKTANSGSLRYKDNTYSWYNPGLNGSAGTQNAGNCVGSSCDTHAYIQSVNDQALCGVSDWRLPERDELRSIVHYGVFSPSIDENYFPHSAPASFWSATGYASFSGNAWHVNFEDGNDHWSSKGGSKRVRLVRGIQPPSEQQSCDNTTDTASSSGRFSAVGEIVTDQLTGLMWARCSLGQQWNGSSCSGSASGVSWQEALQLGEVANQERYAGFVGWRLPNLKELASIAELTCYAPAISLTVFPGAPSARFWSASPVSSASVYTWNINFNKGDDDWDVKSSNLNVRLVRDVQ